MHWLSFVHILRIYKFYCICSSLVVLPEIWPLCVACFLMVDFFFASVYEFIKCTLNGSCQGSSTPQCLITVYQDLLGLPLGFAYKPQWYLFLLLKGVTVFVLKLLNQRFPQLFVELCVRGAHLKPSVETLVSLEPLIYFTYFGLIILLLCLLQFVHCLC